MGVPAALLVLHLIQLVLGTLGVVFLGFVLGAVPTAWAAGALAAGVVAWILQTAGGPVAPIRLKAATALAFIAASGYLAAGVTALVARAWVADPEVSAWALYSGILLVAAGAFVLVYGCVAAHALRVQDGSPALSDAPYDSNMEYDDTYGDTSPPVRTPRVSLGARGLGAGLRVSPRQPSYNNLDELAPW